VNLLVHLTNPLVVHRLGWALLHSLWQCSVAAIVYAVLRSVSRRCSADARYLVTCTALFCMAGAPILTFFYLLPQRVTAPHIEFDVTSRFHTGFSASPHGLQVHSAARWSFGEWNRFLDSVAPWLVVTWVGGVTLLSIRWLHGYRWVRHLRRVQTMPLDAAWLELLEDLKTRFKVSRPVRLVSSALAEVPMVIGWLRPVILLPASSLTGLAPAQLQAILAHELAHVRRGDYLVNWFQNLVETVMFYHPAVGWISGCIRQEREHCCDEMVVRICQDRLMYARALFRLEELRGMPARLAFAAMVALYWTVFVAC
jgi:beta-lactamase regulating signal transducer with metallopeptidase domain